MLCLASKNIRHASPRQLFAEVKQQICMWLNTKDINKIWNDETQKLQGD